MPLLSTHIFKKFCSFLKSSAYQRSCVETWIFLLFFAGLLQQKRFGMASALLWPKSAERLFLFVVSKRLRAFRNYFFTGGAVKENGICNAAFCESAALRGRTASLHPHPALRATFPRRVKASAAEVQFPAKTQSLRACLRPLGGAVA